MHQFNWDLQASHKGSSTIVVEEMGGKKITFHSQTVPTSLKSCFSSTFYLKKQTQHTFFWTTLGVVFKMRRHWAHGSFSGGLRKSLWVWSEVPVVLVAAFMSFWVSCGTKKQKTCKGLYNLYKINMVYNITLRGTQSQSKLPIY